MGRDRGRIDKLFSRPHGETNIGQGNINYKIHPIYSNLGNFGLGLAGFTKNFFHFFWDIIKEEVV